MRAAFYEVIFDLWSFIVGSNVKQSVAPESHLLENGAVTAPLVLEPIKNVALHGVTGFVSETTHLLARPLIAFDNHGEKISYGEEVVILRQEGLFSEITYKGNMWWVPTKAISTSKEDVFPTFSHNKVYPYDNPQTRKVRKYLQDECSGAELFVSLQSLEYILYRLKKKGVSVLWPSQRPRVSGRLQAILKGNKNIYIGIEPKTGSIMEYHKTDQMGVLAYVEEVHPDLSLKISSVSKVKEGLFEVETIEALVWREWRPVFISFK